MNIYSGVKFHFWDFYNELNHKEKILLSICMFSDKLKNYETENIYLGNIDTTLKPNFDNKREYSDILKTAKNDPETLISVFLNSKDINILETTQHIFNHMGNGIPGLLTNEFSEFAKIIISLKHGVTLQENTLILHNEEFQIIDSVYDPKKPYFSSLLLISLTKLDIINGNNVSHSINQFLNDFVESNIFDENYSLTEMKNNFLEENGLIKDFSNEGKLYIHNYLTSLLFEMFSNQINFNKDSYEKMKKATIVKNSKILSLKKEIIALKNMNKEFSIKNIKKLESPEPKQQETLNLIHDLHKSLERKDLEINKQKQKIETLKKTPTKNIYQTLMEKQSEQITEAKITLRDLKAENKSIQKTLSNPISFIKGYIEEFGIDESLFDFLKGHLPLVEKDIESLVEANPENEEIKITKHIGYITFNDEVISVVIGNNKVVIVTEIPEKMYLAEKQFVIINTIGEILYGFKYRFTDSHNDSKTHQFGIVMYINNKAVIRTISNDKFDLTNCKYNLREDTIVSIDQQNNFISFYKEARFNVSDFMLCADIKHHEFWFVETLLKNGVLLRNIKSNETIFNDKLIGELEEHSIISVSNDELVSIFYNLKFYTMSDFYLSYSVGTVKMLDGDYYLNTLENETFKINNVPNKVDLDGVYCKIDEFSNLISFERIEEFEKSARLIQKRTKSTTKSPVSLPEVIAKVLIVGNLNHKKSYSETLRKNGYSPTVLSGFDSFSLIQCEMKENDFIFGMTAHMSHDNSKRMYQFSKKIKGKISFPKYDGANRLIEEILSFSK